MGTFNLNKNILVSVIVPVYNVEKYLNECVESICRQSYKNLEILLIDDGSTDNSGHICDNLSFSDKRISVYHKENEGLGFTRNYGLKKAKGKYIMFVDSDDYIHIDSVKNMLITAEKECAQLVIGGFLKITDAKQFIFEEKYKYEVFENKQVKNILLPRMIGSCPEKRDSIFTVVWGKLYLLESIINNKVIFLSERKMQSEDLAFQLNYIPYLNKVVVIEDIVYFYRQTPLSLTMVYKPDRFEELKKVYKYVNKKIKQYNMPQASFLRADKMLFVQLKGIMYRELPYNTGKTKKQCIEKFKNIVNDQIICEAVRGYPIGLLKPKQKIFVKLLKYKQVKLLFWALQIEYKKYVG